MNLGSTRRYIAEVFRGAGISNFIGEADLILVRLLRAPLASVLGNPERPLTAKERGSIDEIVARRLTGEPLQYILNEAHFWGIPFEVGEGALVPRPDTEFLVEAALKHLPPDSPSFFLDWGTGSGCIAIALLMERPRARTIMAEKNPRSIKWAWKNLKRYNLLGRALLWHSSELYDIPVEKGSLDLVVSNPPYIPTKDIAGLMREVRDHEPRMALDGGEDGMDFYRKLFHNAPPLLKNVGALILEIGDATQAEAIRNEKHSGLVLTEETADFSGIPRCIVWERRA